MAAPAAAATSTDAIAPVPGTSLAPAWHVPGAAARAEWRRSEQGNPVSAAKARAMLAESR